ncbi:MAG: sigma-54 dependent transcriptional regulator [Nitrospirota bacterium]
MSKGNILIVDDEKSILDSLRGHLEDEGYGVLEAESGHEALKILRENTPDLMMLDIRMSAMDGLEVLQRMSELNSNPVVIMMSGHGTIEDAVKAIKLGAYDFLEKPFDSNKVILTISNAIEHKRLEEENRNLRIKIQKKYEIVGDSPAIRRLLEVIKTAGPSNSRVLIFGESGSGKELVARAIHNYSRRREKPFIEVNCAAIPTDLIESELFGHEKGAFTGATTSKKGKFEIADEGTLFLDEVGDMSLNTQAKVLRVLQEQEFQRVGGGKTIKVDVRVITATNKNLEEEIKKGTFREDLYYRLNVIPIVVPPLRERKEDISLLSRYFLKEFASEYGQKPKEIDEKALSVLDSYDWPGNVRELRNMIERVVIMTDSSIITIDDIPSPLTEPVVAPETEFFSQYNTLREARASFEREFILKRLRENNWNITKTADDLEIERSNLHRKIKALGITLP